MVLFEEIPAGCFLSNFGAHVQENIKSQEVDVSIEDKWFYLKKCLLDASKQTCGWTKHPPKCREVWWWNDKVDDIIREKKRFWKEWKSGGIKESYLAAKVGLRQRCMLPRNELKSRNLLIF